MIWAIDFRDKDGVPKRHRFTGLMTWQLMARIADQYVKEGCQVQRIELVKK